MFHIKTAHFGLFSTSNLLLPWFDFSSVFHLFLHLCFGLSEDDAYVDKLPTFERHFDSFAGIVMVPPRERRGDGGGRDLGFEECFCLRLFDPLYLECT